MAPYDGNFSSQVRSYQPRPGLGRRAESGRWYYCLKFHPRSRQQYNEMACHLARIPPTLESGTEHAFCS